MILCNFENMIHRPNCFVADELSNGYLKVTQYVKRVRWRFKSWVRFIGSNKWFANYDNEYLTFWNLQNMILSNRKKIKPSTTWVNTIRNDKIFIVIIYANTTLRNYFEWLNRNILQHFRKNSHQYIFLMNAKHCFIEI